MFKPENQIITTDEWESLAFAMYRSKEVSPIFKSALKIYMKMDPVRAAQEAHTLSALMTARLLARDETNKD